MFSLLLNFILQKPFEFILSFISTTAGTVLSKIKFCLGRQISKVFKTRDALRRKGVKLAKQFGFYRTLYRILSPRATQPCFWRKISVT